MSTHQRWPARPRVGHTFPEELALLGESCREFDRAGVAGDDSPALTFETTLPIPKSSAAAAQPNHRPTHSQGGGHPAHPARRLPAQVPASNDEAPPHVALMLAIHPPRHQQAFWSCATWRQSVRSVDVWYVGFVIVNNSMLVLYSGKLPPVALPGLVQFSWLYMALGLLQSLCAASQAPFYYHARQFLVLLNRLPRLLHAALNASALRSCLAAGTCAPYIRDMSANPTLPPLVIALRLLFLGSGAFVAGLHTTYLRFAFRTQALFQVAYLLLLFSYNSVIAAHVLSAPPLSASVTAICAALDAGSASLLSHTVGLRPPPTGVCSTPAAPWLLVLFAQAFFGFVAPLTLSYVLERAVKLKYLAAEHGQRHLASNTLWARFVSAARFAVLLFVYAMLTWLLVVKYHAALALWALPVDWEGADSAWYYELTGSSPPV